MTPASEDINRIPELLTQVPFHLEKATTGIESSRLYLRTVVELWFVSDILAHLRACSDVWGKSIMAVIRQDNPTMRYVSLRSWMRKPKYLQQAFEVTLEYFTQQRSIAPYEPYWPILPRKWVDPDLVNVIDFF